MNETLILMKRFSVIMSIVLTLLKKYAEKFEKVSFENVPIACEHWPKSIIKENCKRNQKLTLKRRFCYGAAVH